MLHYQFDPYYLCIILAFAPVLLERKANRIRKSLDPEKGKLQEIRTVFDSQDRR